jgi:hypothetical protein
LRIWAWVGLVVDLLVLGLHAEENDIGDVIAHIGDRAAAEIDERHQAGAPLALERRVINADVVGGAPLRVPLVELKVVLRSDPFAEPFSLVFMVEHRGLLSG